MTLGIRTDTFNAEICLINDNGDEVDAVEWHAGRELSVELLQKIQNLLDKQDISLDILTSVIIYEGPGSFTGLRIGFSVANSLGYALRIPVSSATGKLWKELSLKKLSNVDTFLPLHPVYGSAPHITKPKK